MAQFTLDDVRRIMRRCAGVDESVDLDADIHDIEFSDLGYDSLAILELATQIQNEYQVVIPDDAVSQMPTPRAAVEYVNARLSAL
ncbi:MAG TPA: phosphopantetheine-binding protein [Micromonosporaceae bacterium]